MEFDVVAHAWLQKNRRPIFRAYYRKQPEKEVIKEETAVEEGKIEGAVSEAPNPASEAPNTENTADEVPGTENITDSPPEPTWTELSYSRTPLEPLFAVLQQDRSARVLWGHFNGVKGPSAITFKEMVISKDGEIRWESEYGAGGQPCD